MLQKQTSKPFFKAAAFSEHVILLREDISVLNRTFWSENFYSTITMKPVKDFKYVQPLMTSKALL